ncbi:hypothetical protein JAVIER_159 [Vibrio phage Javier]|nr:hypothetical protein JAVIER_159 [Vibrio phage Javier]
MNKFVLAAITASLLSTQAFAWGSMDSANAKEQQQVQRQQRQYAKVQPVPFFNWSLERDMVIQLYQLRNLKAATHVVWRGDTSVIEGDCPAIGYGIPYDTSLTNPLGSTDEDIEGYEKTALTTVGQAEPNGVYASTNTSATWVMCVNEQGLIEPVYVEAKVTGYPYPVNVDYNTNRVTKAGRASVTLRVK